MTTEGKFKLTLREMMLNKPLSEINVTTLCDRIGCHRQTFYYHYQDIYDLLASIFLNEEIGSVSKAANVEEALMALLDYAVRNFNFLRSTYLSAASDLVRDFFYNKIITKMLSLYSPHAGMGITKISYRNAARRFASQVAGEFGFYFKSQDITTAKLEKGLRRYLLSATKVIYPALIQLAKEEKRR